MSDSSEALKVHIDRLEGLLTRVEDKLDKTVRHKENLEGRVSEIEKHMGEEKARLEEQKKAMGWFKYFFAFILTGVVSYILWLLTKS